MNDTVLTKHANEVNQGLPPLNTTHSRSTSFFEFWPSQIIYIPVVLQWIYLSLRYRSLSLPLISNPSIYLAGMIGESKSSVLLQAGDKAQCFIAPFTVFTNNKQQSIKSRLIDALAKLDHSNISFPLIAKPDMGCRGAGVKIIHNETTLTNYLENFPDNAKLLLQHKVPHEAEAGIFYIRKPGQQKGFIFSITLKYTPYVFGDGIHTLAQLIEKDPRAKKISNIYFKRHTDQLNYTVPEHRAFRLSFAGSHCKGSIFRNGNNFITDQLTSVFDEITGDIKDFYYGRFDVRFESIEKLQKGLGFKILEINGASSEATHIWDNNTKLKDVYKTLFYQYKTLFDIGNLNRNAGHNPPGIWKLITAWRAESKLVKQYPETD